MAFRSPAGAAVLVVEPDAGVRQLISAVLELAGFHPAATDTPESAAAMMATTTFAVILRDLNLVPAASYRGLEELRATAPELLRRTVVMTTAAAHAKTELATGTVFAIVGKPFNVNDLVSVVGACALASLDSDGHAEKSASSARRSQRGEPNPGPSMEMRSLQRFAGTVPTLQHLLSVPVRDDREAALRTEIRRTLDTLSATLVEAASGEPSRTRAGVFLAASTVAARLAKVPAPRITFGARHRGDH